MAEYHHTSELCLTKAKYPTFRQLTVLETTRDRAVKTRSIGVNYVPVVLEPCVVLRGKWLQQAGFSTGKKVTVTVEKDRLVLTPASISSGS
ncbi:type I toxin-antitoxin system SymE family toxin [Thalassomonas viridans]|uniref:Type I toxin-antitoxin system SymE family toxin n=1 Tax=Thalassomonas viridans TaxID=137584 RepID=A0AAE9Z6L6_9GAMM|nr:SymE family type I addiction module toxin [Thalassomonas viridans]WDE07059.1 type I toxin-antitoxin system SymE family toxin [Thalassomonas viridans]